MHLLFLDFSCKRGLEYRIRDHKILSTFNMSRGMCPPVGLELTSQKSVGQVLAWQWGKWGHGGNRQALEGERRRGKCAHAFDANSRTKSSNHVVGGRVQGHKKNEKILLSTT